MVIDGYSGVLGCKGNNSYKKTKTSNFRIISGMSKLWIGFMSVVFVTVTTWICAISTRLSWWFLYFACHCEKCTCTICIIGN